jgi:hydroxypyruvate isomerase
MQLRERQRVRDRWRRDHALNSHEETILQWVPPSFLPRPARRLSFNLAIVPGVTAMFPGADLEGRLATARAHGFSGVEGAVPADPVGMGQLLARNDMQHVCMSFARGRPEAGELGIAALPGREKEFRQELRRAIDAARVLRCGLIHPLGGLVPPGEADSCRAVYRENLQRACEEARREGIRVIIEPICAARQPRFVLQKQSEAFAWVAALGQDNLCVMVDVFHARMAGESTAALAASHAAAIGLLQVAHAPQRRQPDAQDPELRATFGALARQGWAGWISGEYVPEGELARSLAWKQALEVFGAD